LPASLPSLVLDSLYEGSSQDVIVSVAQLLNKVAISSAAFAAAKYPPRRRAGLSSAM
jgi:hypothetical protein